MDDLTLESLAKRVEALEQTVANQSVPTKRRDWWNVVTMVKDDEFMRAIDAEGRAIREAEREAARQEGEDSGE